jgi:hypothetical protein
MFEFVIVATDDPTRKIEEGLVVCEALISLNEIWLRDHPEHLCALGQGIIKYDKESEAQVDHHQILRTAPALLEDGKGLCMEIVAFEVAARRVMGLQAKPHIFRKTRDIYHVQMKVLKGKDWKTEDISLELEKKGYVVTPGCKV